MKTEDKIKWFVPIDIEKGKNAAGDEVYKISGRASTQSGKDKQGETLDISGFDVSELKTINYNHQSAKNPDAYIGEVHKAEFKKEGDNNVMDFKGELYPEMPMTKGVVNLMKAFKKRGKQMGVSVEGSVTERGSEDKNDPAYHIVKKARLTALALTPNPINAKTWVTLEKSEQGWQYDEETEVLMKSFEDGTLEAEKEEENQENKKELSKSFVYSKIFDYFYDVNINKAISVFQLVKEISEMEKQPITDETLTKAFEILNIAKGETTKKVDTQKDNDEDDKDMKDNVEKAKMVYKSMEGKPLEEVKQALIKKGYSEVVINKALETPQTGDTINKSEIVDLIKSQNESLSTKFGALATIFQAQKEQNELLTEKLTKSDETIQKLSETVDTLKTDFEKVAKTPNTPKSTTFINKSYQTSPLEGENQEGKQTYNIKNAVDRKALVSLLEEKSGLNKADKSKPLENPGLADIAEEISLMKGISKPESLIKLQGLGIKIVSE